MAGLVEQGGELFERRRRVGVGSQRAHGLVLLELVGRQQLGPGPLLGAELAQAELRPTREAHEHARGAVARPGPLVEHLQAPRHLHPLLRDQRTIAGIGRSWVDELLWTARLSPFQKASELDADARERLRVACDEVLGAALEHYEEVIGDTVPDKLPMPLQVHRRAGAPCPRCAATIQAIHFKDYVMCYCPEEQTGGRVLKDRRLSRLLK